jgi:hypothetical protein
VHFLPVVSWIGVMRSGRERMACYQILSRISVGNLGVRPKVSDSDSGFQPSKVLVVGNGQNLGFQGRVGWRWYGGSIFND